MIVHEVKIYMIALEPSGSFLLGDGAVCRNFYKGQRWKQRRKIVLRRDKYLCQECRRYGRTTPATTVHHIVPLEQNRKLALVSGNLVSLCDACHNAMHDRDTGQLTAKGFAWAERVSPLP